MKQSRTLKLKNGVELELVLDGKRLLGIGQVKIAGTLVRSRRMPIRPYAEDLFHWAYDDYLLKKIEATPNRIVLRTIAVGRPVPFETRLDHSMDKILNPTDWDGSATVEDEMDWIFEPAEETIGEWEFGGFSYRFEFRSRERELFWIMDRATWELGGSARGVTLINQGCFSPPEITFDARNTLSTAGVINFPLNPMMTDMFPRYASHQSFDYQCRGDRTLIGYFDQPGLIRSRVERESGQDEIKHFDRHMFNIGKKVGTIKKYVMLNSIAKADRFEQRTLWTRVFDFIADAARRRYGMADPRLVLTLHHDFWVNFDFQSYLPDMPEVASKLHFSRMRVDPVWENDMTQHQSGNMCCPWQYEIAEKLGGIDGLRKLISEVHRRGIKFMTWIGTHQSSHSPLLRQHPEWVIKMEDGRHFYRSGYNDIIGMDLSTGFGDYFFDCMKRAKEAGGIDGLFYDSFYNFAFMPVNYDHMQPHVQFDAVVKILAKLQKLGYEMAIESLGPWAQPQHGVTTDYLKPEMEFAGYKCNLGCGYACIPTGREKMKQATAAHYYRFLANMVQPAVNLYPTVKGKRYRLDQIFEPLQVQANRDYNTAFDFMKTKMILPDDRGVEWLSEDQRTRVVFAFRNVKLPLRQGERAIDISTRSGLVSKRGMVEVEKLHTCVLGQP